VLTRCGILMDNKGNDLDPHLRRFLIAALLVGSLFPLWVATRRHQFLNDDTYITLTYAKSLAAGHGFVFNHAPATLGTTAPLLTLIVATLSALFPWIEPSLIAVLFTAACWVGIVWVVFLFRRQLDLNDWQATVMGLVVIASGWVDFLGMEAYLFALLLVLGVVLFYRRQWLLAGGSVGLLFLTRGEGILILPLLVAGSLFYTGRGRTVGETIRPGLRILAGFLVPALMWSVYAQLTFGRIVPNTLSVKMAQEQSGLWLSFPERLLEWIPLWERQFALGHLSILNIWWLLVIIGLGSSIIEKRRWLLFLAWIGMYIAGYTALQVAGYWWYQLPILFVLQLFAALGLVRITEAAARAMGRHRKAMRVAPIIIILPVLLLLIKPRVNRALTHPGDARAPSYLTLCRWFGDNTLPSESIAFIEVGYLGYYTDNRIIDLSGLTTPDIVPHVATGDFTSGFWQHEPDFFVFLPDFGWALDEIRDGPQFDRLYQPVATLPGPREAEFVIYAHQ